MKRFLALLVALLTAITIAQTTSSRPPSTNADQWYANQVFYQVFVRSYQDSNGDGVGDFKGLTSRLAYIKELGATALWLLPIYPSPSYHGYDVTDYEGVNPQYGTMQDFDAFLKRAHELGLKVILDWVPNHTSVQHPWFLESKNPDSPKRDWYIWRDQNPGWGRPWGARDPSWYALKTGGSSTKVIFPGTIQSALGAQAWNPNGDVTRAVETSPGVFELVVALPKGNYEYKVALNGSWSVNYGKNNQLNGSNIPLEIPADDTITKFVFDSNAKTVIDSVNNPDKVQAPNAVPPRPTFNDPSTPSSTSYYYGAFWEGMPDLNYRNPQVVNAMQGAMKFWLQKGIDGFRLDAISYIFENDTDNAPHNPATLDWMRETAKFVKSVQPDAMLVGEVWDKPDAVAKYFQNGAGEDLGFNFELRDSIREAVNGGKRAPLEATLDRVAKLYPPEAVDALFTTNYDMIRPQYLGAVRYRLAASLLLTLPGVPFIYYGDEISMPNGPSTDDKDKRTPMRWDSSPNAGFTTGTPWQAFSTQDASINVATQKERDGSLWNHYRNLIRLRQSSAALRSGGFEPINAGDHVMAFVRRLRDQAVIVAINLDTIDGTRANLDLRGTSLEQASGTVQELTLDKTLAPKTVNAQSYPVQIAPGGLVILEIR